jgi:hypothetical protein
MYTTLDKGTVLYMALLLRRLQGAKDMPRAPKIHAAIVFSLPGTGRDGVDGAAGHMEQGIRPRYFFSSQMAAAALCGSQL